MKDEVGNPRDMSIEPVFHRKAPVRFVRSHNAEGHTTQTDTVNGLIVTWFQGEGYDWPAKVRIQYRPDGEGISLDIFERTRDVNPAIDVVPEGTEWIAELRIVFAALPKRFVTAGRAITRKDLAPFEALFQAVAEGLARERSEGAGRRLEGRVEYEL